MTPQQVTTWRRLARRGSLALPAESPLDFAALVLDEPPTPSPGKAPAPLEIEAGGVVVRLDGTGLVLVYRRLEAGKLAWPAIRDRVMRLSRARFEALFDGLEWPRVRGPRRVRRPTAAACLTPGARAPPRRRWRVGSRP